MKMGREKIRWSGNSSREKERDMDQVRAGSNANMVSKVMLSRFDAKWGKCQAWESAKGMPLAKGDG